MLAVQPPTATSNLRSKNSFHSLAVFNSCDHGAAKSNRRDYRSALNVASYCSASSTATCTARTQSLAVINSGSSWYRPQKPVISDNYFSATVVSNKKDLGHILSSTLHFPSFASIFSCGSNSCDGCCILHLPRQAISRIPLRCAPGLLYTQHHTSAGVLRFASTPLSGVWDHSLQTNILTEWFLRVLLDTTPASFPVTKIPRASAL